MLSTTASKVIFRLALLCLLATSVVAIGCAQAEQADLTIDAATRTQVIDGILKRLNDSYVFPETAKKMEESIRERVAKKEYGQITSAKQFATTLTNDLQAVSHDKHLRVRYSFQSIPERVPRHAFGNRLKRITHAKMLVVTDGLQIIRQRRRKLLRTRNLTVFLFRNAFAN